MTYVATFITGAIVGITALAIHNFRRGIRIATEAQREQRERRESGGPVMVSNCKGGKA